jgi:soluble lytic murein transglycosylase-like protein
MLTLGLLFAPVWGLETIPPTYWVPGSCAVADEWDGGIPPQPDPDVVKVTQVLSDRAPLIGNWQRYAEVIVQECREAKLEPMLVLAVMDVESNFNPDAVSSTGDHGIMQLQPATFILIMGHPRYGDRIEDIQAGIRYLGVMKRSFRRQALFLVAYNAGPGTVLTYLRADDDIPERYFRYPTAVQQHYKRLKRLAMLGSR